MVTPNDFITANRYAEGLIVVLFVYHVIYNALQGRFKKQLLLNMNLIAKRLEVNQLEKDTLTEMRREVAEVQRIKEELLKAFPELIDHEH